MKLFTIPNLITLANLLCGCLAIVCAFNGNLVWAAYLVGIAAVLDFLDGFVARALKQHSPIGKDLDSLADMVTFGVVPGVVMFKMMSATVSMNGFFSRVTALANAPSDLPSMWVTANDPGPSTLMSLLPYAAFLITLFSALRLAKFNNDTRQSDSFIGVPTPANSILICSLALIAHSQWGWFGTKSEGGLREVGEYVAMSYKVETGPAAYTWITYLPWILLGISLLMSYLLISEIPLFALKFKSFGWKGNGIRYSFLAAAVILLVLLKFIALPLIIVLYVLMSIAHNLFSGNRKQETGNP